MLGLGPGRRLLDVGGGQGWPGLYLARQTGCTVVRTPVPRNCQTCSVLDVRARLSDRETADSPASASTPVVSRLHVIFASQAL